MRLFADCKRGLWWRAASGPNYSADVKFQAQLQYSGKPYMPGRIELVLMDQDGHRGMNRQMREVNEEIIASEKLV